MKRLILAGAIAAACMLASGSPAAAAARNYDCSKAGNANKAACKGAVAKPAAAASAARPAPKAVPKVAATTTRSVTRTYDCTKAGNANKSQCKGSTTVASQHDQSRAGRPGQADADAADEQRADRRLDGPRGEAPGAGAQGRRGGSRIGRGSQPRRRDRAVQGWHLQPFQGTHRGLLAPRRRGEMVVNEETAELRFR